MVLADEVNPVNQLYRELSSRYKAAWTFHRFMKGLGKFFEGTDLEDRTKQFQSLYAGLREVSTRLNDLDMPPVVALLEEARRRLDGLVEFLDQQDRKIAPSLVRLFFQRVKMQDERILIELVRFYIEAQRGRDWLPERADKVDFLLSRLGGAIADPTGGGDRDRLNRVLAGISEYAAGATGLDPQKVSNRMKLIQAVRSEIEQVESFDELAERELVAHYRNLKHGLGAMVFEKTILGMIVATNLAVAARVNELTQRAQERIFEDYEKVSGLDEQGLLGDELAESVTRLRDKVGSFKQQVEGGTVRIDAMAEIQKTVEEIFGKIAPGDPTELDREFELGGLLAPDRVFATAAERELLGPLFEDLCAALRKASRASEGARGLDSRLLEYRLGEREIEAFARLSSKTRCDNELEQFLLAAASLRRRVRQLVDDLHRAGQEASSGSRRNALQEASASLRIGDLYLRRFDHALEMRLVDDEPTGVKALLLAKMHLMREHSGLWLLVHEARLDG